jgi:hypothetical protein
VGYLFASGEIKQIGATAVTDGITEASTMEIGGTTLHDVSYNEHMVDNIRVGERVAMLLTPSRYVAALRKQDGQVVYASEESRAHLETPMSYGYFAAMALLGIVLTPIGIGLIIILKQIRSYTARKEIVENMAALRQAAL